MNSTTDTAVKITAEPAPVKAKLTALLTSDGFEIHRTGCKDIAKSKAAGVVQNAFTVNGAATQGAVVYDVYGDQIDESTGEGLDYPDTDAAVTAYAESVKFLPCSDGKPADEPTPPPADEPPARVLDADAAAARALLLDERTKAAEGDKLAIPAGYVMHWAYPAGHSRLARTDDAPEGSPKWLARCDEHGTTKAADSAKSARALGSRKVRPDWCKPCKTAATKATADKAKADKAKADRAAAKKAADAAAASADAAADAPASDDAGTGTSDEPAA